MIGNLHVLFQEDTTNTIVARLQALGGSGDPTGPAHEGRWLQQADFVSIVRNVFDLDSSDPETPILGPTELVISDVIFDEPQLEGWKADTVGYNFVDNLPTNATPTGGHNYSIEYIVELVDGTLFAITATGPCTNILQS